MSDYKLLIDGALVAGDLKMEGARQLGLGVELAEEGLAEFTQIHIVNEAR